MTYCVYITFYRGDKLPPFYVGSSYTTNVLNNGYHGTVKSKKYGKVWREEIKTNHSLFQTFILSTHEIETDARKKEYMLQKSLDVVRCPLFTNLAFANMKFGASGENHYLFGKSLSDETKIKISKAKKGKPLTYVPIGLKGCSNPMFGKQQTVEAKEKNRQSHLNSHHSEETKCKMSKSQTGLKFWNDGNIVRRLKESPGDGWVRGLL